MNSDQVSPIQEGSFLLSSREDVLKYVELPLVDCVWSLINKGIETFMSSANGSNIYLSIFFDTLSNENKQLLERLKRNGVIVEYGTSHGYIQRPIVTLRLPPCIYSVSSIEDKYNTIAERFVDQRRKKFEVITKKFKIVTSSTIN